MNIKSKLKEGLAKYRNPDNTLVTVKKSRGVKSAGPLSPQMMLSMGVKPTKTVAQFEIEDAN